MSSPKLSHRRRSHSASSPILHRQPDDVKWRISAKRSRPSSIRSPSYKDLAVDQPAEKWDVDQWRRGKRARRDPNAEESPDEFSFSTLSPDLTFPTPEPSTSSFPVPSRLVCTSAAFQFFPQKKQPRRHHPQAGSGRAHPSRDAPPREGERISSDEARRMRANAFGELHRSVAENGEGFVGRMRDWERRRFKSARSESSAPSSPPALDSSRRSWRRLTAYYGTPQATATVAEQSEGEDDIFIVGETSSFPSSRSPAHKKRALSLSMMDVDLPEMEDRSSPFAGRDDSERSSSPVERSSGLSVYSSDDEAHADMDTDLSASGLFSTPALSHTYSISTNSSLVSLHLSQLAGDSNHLSHHVVMNASTSSTIVVPGCTSPAPTPLPATASRSEKAIAALTLTMANGAVGITDYEALRMTEELTTLDESHAGELWS